MKNLYCCDLNTGHQIANVLCTWYSRTTVVSYAKICRDHVGRIRIKARWGIIRFFNYDGKLIIKGISICPWLQAPEPCLWWECNMVQCNRPTGQPPITNQSESLSGGYMIVMSDSILHGSEPVTYPWLWARLYALFQYKDHLSQGMGILMLKIRQSWDVLSLTWGSLSNTGKMTSLHWDSSPPTHPPTVSPKVYLRLGHG